MCVYMPRPYLYLILSLQRDLPQLRTRCAGEEAVPSTCVGDARPCAGRGAGRARSAVPRSDRAKSKRARSALALALAAKAL